MWLPTVVVRSGVQPCCLTPYVPVSRCGDAYARVPGHLIGTDDSGGSRRGTFTSLDTNTGYIGSSGSCGFHQTVGHSPKASRSSVTYEWTAPSGTPGDITFTAVGLLSQSTWYRLTTTLEQVVPPSVTATPSNVVATGSTSLTVVGAGFADGDTSVVLSSSGGTITQPTSVSVDSVTQLTLTVAALDDDLAGETISAVVTTSVDDSGSAVVIATVQAPPTVAATSGSSNVGTGATSITITGTGFVDSDTEVTLSAASGTVTQPTSVSVSSSTELVVTVQALNSNLAGQVLQAVVTTYGSLDSGVAVGVATVRASPTVSDTSATNVATGTTTLTLTGSNFVDGSTTVALSADSGTVTETPAVEFVDSGTLTLTVSALGSDLINVAIEAVVTTYGSVSSGAAVAIATVRATPTVSETSTFVPVGATSIVITGTNFDGAGSPAVSWSSSGGGTAPVTQSVSVDSSTQMTVTTTAGVDADMDGQSILAVVTVYDLNSGAAVSIASVGTCSDACATASCTGTGIGDCTQCGPEYRRDSGDCVACSAECSVNHWEQTGCQEGGESVDRVCVDCADGNCAGECSDVDGECDACAGGFYRNGAACEACTVCQANEYMASDCQDGDEGNDRVCVACSDNNCAGECTDGSGVCDACAAGSYRSGSDCLSCAAACGTNQYEQEACQDGGDESQNRVCVACSTNNCAAECGDGTGVCDDCATGFYRSGDDCVACESTCAENFWEEHGCQEGAETQNRVCNACADQNCAGECADDTGQCDACASGYFDSAGEDPPAGTCTECAASGCGSGSYQATTCSATTDNTCASCAAACSTCDGPGADDCTECAPDYRDCGTGTCVNSLCGTGGDCASAADCESGVCTSTICQAPTCSDSVLNGDETDVDCGGATCDGCDLDESCSANGDCADGLYCDSDSCANCHEACETCDGADASACTACASGYYDSGGEEPPSGTCTAWSTCSESEYAASPGSATADRDCQTLTTCDGDTEYEEEPPTESSDRVCGDCHERCVGCDGPELDECHVCASGYWMSGSACVPWSTCGSQQYETSAPSATEDRGCASCDSKCNGCDGPTASDCTACASGYYANAGTSGECTAWSECGATQYQTSAPSTTEDRGCGDCHASCTEGCTGPNDTDCTACSPSHWENEVGSCVALTTCEEDEYESEEPTPTSDRTCMQVTTCGGDEYEVVDATATSDRQCGDCAAECDGCTGAGSSSCTSCAEGHYDHGGTCEACSGCEDGTYESGPACAGTEDTTCSDCDPACGTCDGGNSADCLSCAEGYYDSDGTDPPTGSCVAWQICDPDTQYESEAGSSTSDRTCAALQECDAESEYESTPPTSTTDRECAPCSERCDGCDGPEHSDCSSCASGYWMNGSVCDAWSECGAQEYEAFAPSSTVDRVCRDCDETCDGCDGSTASDCTACAAEHYANVDTGGECTPWSVCGDAEYEEAEPSESADRSCGDCHSACEEGCVGPTAAECTTCASGFWQDTETDACVALTICGSGEFESVPPTETSDRECAAVTNCNSDTEYEVTPPTETSDRECGACSAACAGGCTAAGAEGCVDCAAQYYRPDTACVPCTVCSGNTYDDGSGCSGSVDAQCASCAAACDGCTAGDAASCLQCADGYFDSEGSDPPAGQCTLHTECGLGEFVAIPGNSTTDAVCRTVSECDAVGEYEVSQPTATSDRVCLSCAAECEQCVGPTADDCVTCADGAWHNNEGNVGSCSACDPACATCDGPTAGDCETCAAEYYAAPGGNCVAMTECGAQQFEETPPTSTTDRECGDCSTVCDGCVDSADACVECAAGHFGTPRGDGETSTCTELTECAEDEYESVAPTATTDRECTEVSECQPGFEEDEPPTATSDRTCVCVQPVLAVGESVPFGGRILVIQGQHLSGVATLSLSAGSVAGVSVGVDDFLVLSDAEVAVKLAAGADASSGVNLFASVVSACGATAQGRVASIVPAEYSGSSALNSQLSLRWVVFKHDDGTRFAEFHASLSAIAWLGVGPGPGTMIGTDAALVLPEQGTVRDTHIEAQLDAGVITDGHDDITGEWVEQADGTTEAWFTRPLVSSDEDDVSFAEAGTTTVAWAYGSTNTFALHLQRGTATVELLPNACSAAVTCNGHGTCGASAASPCDCDTGYTGAACDVCADGFRRPTGGGPRCVSDAVDVQLVLQLDIESIGQEGSEQYKEFVSDFFADISNATGVPESRFELIAISAGSVVIRFRILAPPSDEADDDAAEQLDNVAVVAILSSLIDQGPESGNALYSGRVTRHVEPTQELHIEFSAMDVGDGPEYPFFAALDDALSISWGVGGDNIRVRLTYSGIGWVGIAVSPDRSMLATPSNVAHIGLPADGLVSSFALQEKTVDGVVQLETGQDGHVALSDTFVEQSDGQTTVRFTRPLSDGGADAARSISASGTTTLIYAYGSSNSLGLHTKSGAAEIDFTSGGAQDVGVAISGLKVAHGILMSLSWGLLLPAGTIMAYFYKHRHPWRFFVHRALQVTGFLFAVIGTAIAFVMVEGAHFNAALHSIVGTAVMVLACTQITNAVLRPHPPEAGESSRKREVWFLCHRVTGWTATVFGLANVYVGLLAIGAPVAYFAVAGGVTVCLLALACTGSRSRASLEQRRNKVKGVTGSYGGDVEAAGAARPGAKGKFSYSLRDVTGVHGQDKLR